MNRFRPSWQALVVVVLMIAAVLLGAMTQPEADALANPAATAAYPYLGVKWMMYCLLGGAALVSMLRLPAIAEALLLFVAAHLVAWLLIHGITGFEGTARGPYYLVLASAWLLGWRCVAVLSGMRPALP